MQRGGFLVGVAPFLFRKNFKTLIINILKRKNKSKSI